MSHVRFPTARATLLILGLLASVMATASACGGGSGASTAATTAPAATAATAPQGGAKVDLKLAPSPSDDNFNILEGTLGAEEVYVACSRSTPVAATGNIGKDAIDITYGDHGAWFPFGSMSGMVAGQPVEIEITNVPSSGDLMRTTVSGTLGSDRLSCVAKVTYNSDLGAFGGLLEGELAGEPVSIRFAPDPQLNGYSITVAGTVGKAGRLDVVVSTAGAKDGKGLYDSGGTVVCTGTFSGGRWAEETLLVTLAFSGLQVIND